MPAAASTRLAPPSLTQVVEIRYSWRPDPASAAAGTGTNTSAWSCAYPTIAIGAATWIPGICWIWCHCAIVIPP